MIFKEYDWFYLYRNAKEAIPCNIPEAKVQKVSIYIFIDYDFAGDNYTRRRQTGVLKFINKDPIHWYRKINSIVEASTFEEELFLMQAGVEMF